MLGYAATTDVSTCRSSWSTAIGRRAAGELIERFSASPYFDDRRGGGASGGRRRRIWRTGGRGWRSSSRAGFETAVQRRRRRSPTADGAGARRRHRRELVRRGAGVRGRARRRVQRRCSPMARRRAGPAGDRRARPRLVQPGAREPGLHGARRARAAAARDHREPVVDGDRPRARAGHARAAERDAARPLGADPRQAAAVRARRLRRRPARASPSPCSGSRCRCGAAWRCCSARACVYLLCTLGLGLFVSTISSTQQQAMMTATFFFLVPMIYLSGFIFPIENMPRADSVGDDADSAAVLPGDRPRHLPEGRRPRRAVAAVRPRWRAWGASSVLALAADAV